MSPAHTNTDPRGGLPSCSGFQAVFDCPGKPRMEGFVPSAQRDKSSYAAERGTRIHLALETGDTRQLNEEELAEYSACFELREQHIDAWKTRLGPHINGAPVTFKRVVEERLWHTRDGVRRWSGMADLVIQAEWTGADGGRVSAALVLDYKTGPGHVPAPGNNLQLAALALLVADEYNTNHIAAAIVQPSVSRSIAAYRDYSAGNFASIRQQIDGLLHRSRRLNARLNPGESQCKYCDANKAGVCPASGGNLMVVASEKLQRLHRLSDGALEMRLDACGAAEKTIGYVRAEAMRRIKSDPAALNGWHLKQGARQRKIVSTSGAWEAVVGMVDVHAFLAACTITPKDLSRCLWDAAKAAGKKLTQAQAAEQVSELLGDSYRETRNKDSLARGHVETLPEDSSEFLQAITPQSRG